MVEQRRVLDLVGVFVSLKANNNEPRFLWARFYRQSPSKAGGLTNCYQVTLSHSVCYSSADLDSIVLYNCNFSPSAGSTCGSFVSSGVAVDCWQSFDMPSVTASAEA